METFFFFVGKGTFKLSPVKPISELPDDFYNQPEKYDHMAVFQFDWSTVPDDLEYIYLAGRLTLEDDIQTDEGEAKAFINLNDARDEVERIISLYEGADEEAILADMDRSYPAFGNILIKEDDEEMELEDLVFLLKVPIN